MAIIQFPVIDPVATGANITRLRRERGFTVRDLQQFFGFEEPQAIYKWQRGQSLPSIDNLYALSALLHISMNEILVPSSHIDSLEQQAPACCSNHITAVFFRAQGYGMGRSCGVPVHPAHLPLSFAIPIIAPSTPAVIELLVSSSPSPQMPEKRTAGYPRCPFTFLRFLPSPPPVGSAVHSKRAPPPWKRSGIFSTPDTSPAPVWASEAGNTDCCRWCSPVCPE